MKKDIKVIKNFTDICVQSLDPETFEKLIDIIDQLIINRHLDKKNLKGYEYILK